MKSKILATAALALALHNVFAADPAPEANPVNVPGDVEVNLETVVVAEPGKEGAETPALPADIANFCFLAGKPPTDVKYTIIRQVKVAKGSYGGVKDILPKFARYAQSIGADAIVDYAGSQRFGFWPWRIVRPVVRGVAVKWTDTPAKDCASLGGATLQQILDTNKAPI